MVIGAAACGEPPVEPVPLPQAQRIRANPARLIKTDLRMLPPFLLDSTRKSLALDKRLPYVRHGENECQ